MNSENVLRNAFRSQLNVPEQALAPNLTGKPPCPSPPLLAPGLGQDPAAQKGPFRVCRSLWLRAEKGFPNYNVGGRMR